MFFCKRCVTYVRGQLPVRQRHIYVGLGSDISIDEFVMSVCSVRDIYVCGGQPMVSHLGQWHGWKVLQAMTATSEAQHDTYTEGGWYRPAAFPSA